MGLSGGREGGPRTAALFAPNAADGSDVAVLPRAGLLLAFVSASLPRAKWEPRQRQGLLFGPHPKIPPKLDTLEPPRGGGRSLWPLAKNGLKSTVQNPQEFKFPALFGLRWLLSDPLGGGGLCSQKPVIHSERTSQSTPTGGP